MTVILGFTGSQLGMTPAQWEALRYELTVWQPSEVHHGLCIGADEQFHRLVRELFGGDVRIVGHRCTLRWKQATALYFDCDELRPPLPPLERNGNIVAPATQMAATPAGAEEVIRSGTWATIRRARKAGTPIAIFRPDGTLLT